MDDVRRAENFEYLVNYHNNIKIAMVENINVVLRRAINVRYVDMSWRDFKKFDKSDDDGILCAILGFQARQLPYKHIFHSRCIMTWFFKRF